MRICRGSLIALFSHVFSHGSNLSASAEDEPRVTPRAWYERIDGDAALTVLVRSEPGAYDEQAVFGEIRKRIKLTGSSTLTTRSVLQNSIDRFSLSNPGFVETLALLCEIQDKTVETFVRSSARTNIVKHFSDLVALSSQCKNGPAALSECSAYKLLHYLMQGGLQNPEVAALFKILSFRLDSLIAGDPNESLVLKTILVEASMLFVSQPGWLDEGVQHAFVAYWQKFGAELSTLLANDFIVNADRIREFEPLLISYISLGRYFGTIRTSGWCKTLRDWKYAIDVFQSSQATFPIFWMNEIGPKVLQESCDSVFSDFNQRLALFRTRTRRSDTEANLIVIEVDRNNVLNPSMDELRLSGDDFNPNTILEIQFAGEAGIDAGGLLREWYTLVAQSLMLDESDQGVFEYNEVTRNYRVKSRDGESSALVLAGKFVGKALIDRQPLPVKLSDSMYKFMINGLQNAQLDMSDCEAEDPEWFRNLQWLLDIDLNSPEAHHLFADTSFTVSYKHNGVMTNAELIEKGNETRVTNENKQEYGEKMCEFKLIRSVEPQIAQFLQGFHSMVPVDQLKNIFSVSELRQMIQGTEVVDLNDLMSNTQFSAGYNAQSEPVQWLWQVLEEYSQEKLRTFLKLVTGSTQVPVGGFKNLQGRNGHVYMFEIARIDLPASATDRPLPTTHTCYNKLDLPEYASIEELEQKLELALRAANGEFDDRRLD